MASKHALGSLFNADMVDTLQYAQISFSLSFGLYFQIPFLKFFANNLCICTFGFFFGLLSVSFSVCFLNSPGQFFPLSGVSSYSVDGVSA